MFIKHNRKSIRLKGYDYANNGYYFVTICTKNKYHYFGQIKKKDIVELNQIGEIVKKYWNEIPKYFKFVKLHEYVIMPNHIHGVLQIDHFSNKTLCEGARLIAPLIQKNSINSIITCENIGGFAKNKNPMINKNSLSNIIRVFKALCSYNINKIHPHYFKWQRNYHERIIQSEIQFQNIKNYIKRNPQRWGEGINGNFN